jgi:hypothetical protein
MYMTGLKDSEDLQDPPGMSTLTRMGMVAAKWLGSVKS